VTDLASRIKALQDDFQALTGRAAWVGACVAVRPGQVWALGLGRSGATCYLKYRVWSYDSSPPPALGEGGQFSPDDPVFSELLSLTQQAGALLQELVQGGRYKFILFPPNTVPYQRVDVIQLWLVFLLHSRRTLGHCQVKGPGGGCACAQIKDGETTLAWIDQYAGVCLAALAGLKANLLASSDRRPTGGKPRKRQSSNEARDRFCYAQLKVGTTLKEIRAAVNSRQGWEPLATDQAVSQAAKRYAQRHGKEWPI
jgi:hypothetical protein